MAGSLLGGLLGGGGKGNGAAPALQGLIKPETLQLITQFLQQLRNLLVQAVDDYLDAVVRFELVGAASAALRRCATALQSFRVYRSRSLRRPARVSRDRESSAEKACL